jgi:hypothetical protein
MKSGHDSASSDTDIYLAYVPNRYLSRETRVFIDFLLDWDTTRDT